MINLLKFYFGNSSTRFSLNLRLMYWFRERRLSFMVRLLRLRLENKFGCHISPESDIDESVSFPHPVAIVIGDGVKVGKNSIIYQSVTIGGARIGDWRQGRYPRLGEEVVVYSGVALIGDIDIGSGAVIGANSVVNKDVGCGDVVVGSPAKSIKRKME